MATTRKCRPSEAKLLPQFSSAVNVTPWMSMRTGAPGGPAHSHIRVAPRPGNSVKRVRGAGGSPGRSRTTTLHPPLCRAGYTSVSTRGGGKYARGVLSRGAAGHDVTAAERQLANPDVLHQRLQLLPG